MPVFKFWTGACSIIQAIKSISGKCGFDPIAGMPTFNVAFAATPEGEECALETIRLAIDNMIASNDTIFCEILSNIPEKQKELLCAITKEDEAERIISVVFVNRSIL